MLNEEDITMKKVRLTLLPLSFMLALGLTITLVGGVFAIGDADVEVADRTGFAQATLDDGTIIQYIGDLNTTYGPSGSGVFDSFVRLQGKEGKTPTEKGYNTDGTREWDTKAGNFTHSILLSQIPTVIIDDSLYWEFYADINDSDNTPLISLDDFELYLTDDPNLSGYPFNGNADRIYDYTAANNGYFVLINDVNQGSGRGDLRYLVPQDGFDTGNCNYGNPACTTYLVLYSVWGGKDAPYDFDGGFEEWKVKKYPILLVSKDINGSFDTPVSWTIVKVYDATYALFTGESVIHDYEVSVDPIFGDPENTMVYGTITIIGDSKDDVNASITDKFNDIAATITGCSVPQNIDGTYLIAEDAIVTCSYELALGGGPVDGTNVARASYSMPGGVFLAFQGSTDILAEDYIETLTGYPDINITDTNGEAWTASAAEASWTYQRTFTCNGDQGTHVNTATITETGQSDIATVVVNCYTPSVTKTADEYYSRYFEWEITKSVTPGSWGLFTGESGTSDYTVILDQTGFHENDWQVMGTITIANPHPSRDADLTQVLDNAGGISGDVDCPSMTVPALSSLVCTYATGVQDSVDDNPFDNTNTATATQQLYNFDADGNPSLGGTQDYQGTWPINFSEALVELVDEVATVSDTYADSPVIGAYTDDHTFTYSRSFTCDEDEGSRDNTASFVTNDTPLTGSDDASVAVNCYDLDVTKTADEFYTRYYTWMIDKVVDNPGPITIPPGGSVVLNYTVSVDVWSVIDNDWQVTGNIVIANSHPTRNANLTQVLDNAGGITGLVSCPVFVVPANSSLTCTYDTGLQDGPDANPFGPTNTAIATQQLYNFASDGSASADGTLDYQGTWPIDFSQASISYVDEAIDVDDSYAGFLGTVYATDTLPASFNYQRTVTADIIFCGSFTVENTADFVTIDTQATGDDSVSVVIEVPCQGCTPGFWQGGAGSQLWNEPNDPQWVYGGTNPYIHTTLFNTFFYLDTDSRLDSLTMMDLVGSGGGDDPAIKAARDMVAAYLNEAAFPASFPATSLADLEAMWYAAVAGGDAAFTAFHIQVAGWNSPVPPGNCPLT